VWVNGQVGLIDFQFEQVLIARQMERGGQGTAPGTLFEQVGNAFTAESMELGCVDHGFGACSAILDPWGGGPRVFQGTDAGHQWDFWVSGEYLDPDTGGTPTGKIQGEYWTGTELKSELVNMYRVAGDRRSTPPWQYISVRY